MGGAWILTRKDLKLLARDRRALILLVALPLVFISVLGMSTGQFLTRGDQPKNLKLAIVRLDESDAAKQFVDSLGSEGGLELQPCESRAAARAVVAKGDATLGLVVGPEYFNRVDDLTLGDVLNPKIGPLAAGPSSLDLELMSRSNGLADAVLLERLIFIQAIRSALPIVAEKNAIARRWLRNEPAEAASETPAPLTNEASAVARPNRVYLILVPGFTVMFVFFLVNIMARSFIEEADRGTLQRLRLSPLRPVSVLVGKTLPFYLVSLMQVSLLFLCGHFLFGMTLGPQPLWLIPTILCTSLAATSLGLLLSTVVKTDQQVSAYGTSLVLVMGGLSGCFVPREWLPPLMKNISLATPHAWALTAFDRVLTRTEVDTGTVLACCGALLVFAALFFSFGCWRFRQMAQ